MLPLSWSTFVYSMLCTYDAIFRGSIPSQVTDTHTIRKLPNIQQLPIRNKSRYQIVKLECKNDYIFMIDTNLKKQHNFEQTRKRDNFKFLTSLFQIKDSGYTRIKNHPRITIHTWHVFQLQSGSLLNAALRVPSPSASYQSIENQSDASSYAALQASLLQKQAESNKFKYISQCINT